MDAFELYVAIGKAPDRAIISIWNEDGTQKLGYIQSVQEIRVSAEHPNGEVRLLIRPIGA